MPRLRSLLLTPLSRPPVLVVGSFLAVTCGIAANALFLQSRPHPAPLVATRGVAEVQEGREEDELVLAVQSALRQAGYYSGPLDGLEGPQTESAILAFEAGVGRPRTGAVSRDILAALEAASDQDAAVLSEMAAKPETPSPDSRVAAVQHALAIAAYGPLKADGVFGPETRDAIIRFQRDHDLPLTGEINDQLIVELRAAGALQDYAAQDR